MSNKRYLVVCSAGDNSLHKLWLEPASYKNFDLLITYYGNQKNRYLNDCDIYLEEKGTKFPKLYNIIKSLGTKIFHYDAVWVPDDDMNCDCKTINQMFQIFEGAQLLLGQPALTPDSYHLHPITLRNDHFLLRYTDFVEIMAPIFSRKCLQLLCETFWKSESGWGLDLMWPKLLGYPTDKIAVIDATPVRHTRATGTGDLYKNLSANPYDQLNKLLAEYNLTLNFNFKVYSGIPR